MVHPRTLQRPSASWANSKCGPSPQKQESTLEVGARRQGQAPTHPLSHPETHTCRDTWCTHRHRHAHTKTHVAVDKSRPNDELIVLDISIHKVVMNISKVFTTAAGKGHHVLHMCMLAARYDHGIYMAHHGMSLSATSPAWSFFMASGKVLQAATIFSRPDWSTLCFGAMAVA